MTLSFGSLFAGIGGFDLGLERVGMICKWQVEIDPFRQQEALEKHWPNVRRYMNVRDCGRHNLEAVDLVCGGFPCQPFSNAGRRRGERDDRNLWPEMRRILEELRPDWVLAENVPGIKNIYLDTILSDLEGLGYTWGALDIPAVALGAPHIRHRLFIVAHADSEGELQQEGRIGKERGWACDSREDVAYASQERRGEGQAPNREQPKESQGTTGRCGGDGESPWLFEPRVGRVVDGFSSRMDQRRHNKRLAALGDSVVPQVVEWIGRYIVAVEDAGQ